MSEIGDAFKELKEHYSKIKEEYQQNHLESHLKMLDNYPKNIKYTIKNYGEHYIITITKDAEAKVVDFWPSTGKWIVRNKKRTAGFKVPNLLKYFKLPLENSSRFISN